MSKIEEKLLDEIINLIRDNLQELIKNDDLCLYYFKTYCSHLEEKDFPINNEYLNLLTEDSLYALLNADFLYGEVPMWK